MSFERSYFNKIVETVGAWENKKEADSVLEKSEIKEGLELRIRVVKTNDKSGKATPIDRILIIAPESANPQSILDVEEISWDPFLVSEKITKLTDYTQ